MNYVFDSSSLIYLGKTRILEKLFLLKGEKYVTQAVYEEVIVKGLERKEPEAAYIKRLIEKKLFIIKKPKTEFENIRLLSKADMEVLTLAKETKSTPIIDEVFATNVARAFGMESHGSIYILLKLLEKKAITKNQATETLDKMINLGFYLSTDLYKSVLKVIEKT